MAGHDHSLKPYAIVLGLLFVLTLVTVAAAYVDFGHPWSDVVALAIAVAKATLVVAFFMHVREATSLIKITAAGGFFWMAIFFLLILADYRTRPFVLELF